MAENVCTVYVGIDPDTAKSGIAVLRLDPVGLELAALPFPELLDRLLSLRDSVVIRGGGRLAVVIEAGWMNAKSNFHGPSGRRGERIAKNVGANHETGRKIAEMCRHWGIPCRETAPLPLRMGGRSLWSGAGGKITHGELVAATGIALGSSNQEERDAALLAWSAAGLPLRMKGGK